MVGLRSISKLALKVHLGRYFATAPLILSSAVVNLRDSGIREVMRLSAEMDRLNPERKVIHLEVGQPNFPTPPHIVDAAVQSLRAGNTTYIASNGLLSLREAIAQRYNAAKIPVPTTSDQIIVTTGAMTGMYSLFLSLLNRGDECLLSIPGFPNYQQTISLIGAKSVPFLCRRENNYLPTIPELEALVTANTKCLVIINPGNPTGACYNRDLVCDIVKFAKKHDIYLISDEIYGGIVFDGAEHVCAAEYDDHGNASNSKIIVVSGFSKEFAMTGFRVGWVRAAPYLVTQLTKLQEPVVSCGVPFCHSAALEALINPLSKDCTASMVQEYQRRRDVALQILQTRNRPSSYTPGGAFYLPVDISSSGMGSRDFAMKLLSEKRCAVAPGVAFNTSDDNNRVKMPVRSCDQFIRVSLANSIDNVSEGIHLLCDLMDEIGVK